MFLASVVVIACQFRALKAMTRMGTLKIHDPRRWAVLSCALQTPAFESQPVDASDEMCCHQQIAHAF